MSRRAVRKASLDMAAYSPAVQAAVDSLAVKVVAELEKRFDKLMAEGKIGELELRDILDEFNSIARSMKRPASSLNMIALPQPIIESGTLRERAPLSRGEIQDARKKQQKFLKAGGGEE